MYKKEYEEPEVEIVTVLGDIVCFSTDDDDLGDLNMDDDLIFD